MFIYRACPYPRNIHRPLFLRKPWLPLYFISTPRQEINRRISSLPLIQIIPTVKLQAHDSHITGFIILYSNVCDPWFRRTHNVLCELTTIVVSELAPKRVAFVYQELFFWFFLVVPVISMAISMLPTVDAGGILSKSPLLVLKFDATNHEVSWSVPFPRVVALIAKVVLWMIIELE